MDVTFFNPSWGGTAGDAISTLDDLKIWVKALVQGTLISPEFQKERLTFKGVPGISISTATYGLGIAKFENGFIIPQLAYSPRRT